MTQSIARLIRSTSREHGGSYDDIVRRVRPLIESDSDAVDQMLRVFVYQTLSSAKVSTLTPTTDPQVLSDRADIRAREDDVAVYSDTQVAPIRRIASPSRKRSVIATWHAAVLQEIYTVNKQQVRLGEMNRDQVLAVAETLAGQSNALAIRSRRFNDLAAVMHGDDTVADLLAETVRIALVA